MMKRSGFWVQLLIFVVAAPATFVSINWLTGDRPLLSAFEQGAVIGVALWRIVDRLVDWAMAK